MFQGKEHPYRVGVFFVRDSKRRFDYINIFQVVADLMVMNGLIEDDSADFLIPVFLGYKVDKTNPGVYLVPIDAEDMSQKIPEDILINRGDKSCLN